MSPPLPLNARLAGFYLFYYAAVGAFMPYWSPYLEARGFTAAQMGIAYALMGLARSIMPIAWGWWADVTGKRIGTVRVAAVISLLIFMGIPFADSIVAIATLMVVYSLFWHALLSQFEVITLNHLSNSGGDYSRVRLWGSVGFVVAVLGLGPILDHIGVLPLPWLVGVLFTAMVVSSWLVPESPDAPATAMAAPRIFHVLRRPEILALLAACTLSQMSFAPYYHFFTLFLDRYDYSRGMAGFLWALAVIAEIGLFLVMSRLISGFGARRLLIVVLAATAGRWLLLPMVVDSLPMLVLLQLTHALTFGAYHSVAVYYIQRNFPGSLQGRGQAIYNAAAYGVGGSIGAISAGYLWEHLSPESTYYFAAGAALLGSIIAWRYLKDPE